MDQKIKVTLEFDELNEKPILVNVEVNKEKHCLVIKFLNDFTDYVKYPSNNIVLDKNLTKLQLNYNQTIPDDYVL
jgi:hypothetical protein